MRKLIDIERSELSSLIRAAFIARHDVRNLKLTENDKWPLPTEKMEQLISERH
jgi:hypothetical protein